MSFLFSEFQLRSVRLRNRVIASPLEKNLSDRSGGPTLVYAEYVRARAKGGVGLIVPEASYIHPLGRGSAFQLGINDDRLIPKLRSLVEAAHAEGAAIAMQINFSSRQTTSAITGFQPWSVSGVNCSVLPAAEELHVMSLEDISWIRSLYVDAARRVKAAGFDAVMLHGAHGYLFNEFFSPHANRRQDLYGGSFENRARLPLEVVRDVRDAVGPGFPIAYRMSADELRPGGFTVEDSIRLAESLERAGVDLIDVSTATYESGFRISPLPDSPQAPNAPVAARIRAAISIPVSVCGRIFDLSVAEAVLASGAADFVTLGRTLHADPDAVRKSANGQMSAIRPCVSCMVCVDRRNQALPTLCSVNPETGREGRRRPAVPRGSRQVVVIGAGLSGLHAAERSVERGYRVVVFESSDDVGGQLRIAAGLPFMSDFTKISDYLKGRLAHLKVDLRLRTTADMASLRMIGPDAIIVATGATPWIPPIPGLDKLAYDTIATFDASRLAGPTLVIGGGVAGLAVALEVAARGFEVNLVEQGSAWGEGAAAAFSGRLIDELQARPSVTWHSQTTIERFGEDGVLLQKDGKRQAKALPAHIVVARDMQAETYLADQLTEGFTNIPVFRVGDCVAPRGMADAAFEGAAAAERL